MNPSNNTQIKQANKVKGELLKLSLKNCYYVVYFLTTLSFFRFFQEQLHFKIEWSD